MHLEGYYKELIINVVNACLSVRVSYCQCIVTVLTIYKYIYICITNFMIIHIL